MRRSILAALFLFAATPARAESDTAVHQAMPLPSGRVHLTEGPAGAALRLDGIITPTVADRFETLIAAIPDGMPLMVELNSPGGYTTAGYAMIERLLGERDRGRPVATRVRSGEICESMCVAVFMAGQQRFAAADSVFMVHAPRGLRTGTVTVRSTTRMIDRLESLGADADWLRRVREAGGFSGRTDYRTTAEALVADRSGVVTVLVPGDAVAEALPSPPPAGFAAEPGLLEAAAQK